jgi:hypothetical protein
LFDSNVSVTIRQSDTEAIASAAATASLSLGDATATAGLLKPVVPEDRVMVQILKNFEADQTPAYTGESPVLSVL